MKWAGILAATLLVVSGFIPWVFIESRIFTLTGVDTSGTNYGKPAYFHFALAAFFLVFTFVPRIWAKRLNLLVTGLNLGWALRNFFVLANCAGGECPIRKAGIWIMLISSIFMLLSALFPDMEISDEKK